MNQQIILSLITSIVAIIVAFFSAFVSWRNNKNKITNENSKVYLNFLGEKIKVLEHNLEKFNDEIDSGKNSKGFEEIITHLHSSFKIRGNILKNLPHYFDAKKYNTVYQYLILIEQSLAGKCFRRI